MKIQTYNHLKILFINKGYSFREESFALNLGAIRKNDSKSNKFDDLGFLAYRDRDNKPQLLTFAVTTDPGKYYLMNPMNKNGTIITVPGQYKEVYGKGLHNGKYECFKQVDKMFYVRDNDRNDILNFDLYRNPELLKIHGFWGINGTNYHRASEWQIVQWVERYSGGCCVVQSVSVFKQLINLRDMSNLFGFKRWDYTLFEETDL